MQNIVNDPDNENVYYANRVKNGVCEQVKVTKEIITETNEIAEITTGLGGETITHTLVEKTTIQILQSNG